MFEHPDRAHGKGWTGLTTCETRRRKNQKRADYVEYDPFYPDFPRKCLPSPTVELWKFELVRTKSSRTCVCEWTPPPGICSAKQKRILGGHEHLGHVDFRLLQSLFRCSANAPNGVHLRTPCISDRLDLSKDGGESPQFLACEPVPAKCRGEWVHGVESSVEWGTPLRKGKRRLNPQSTAVALCSSEEHPALIAAKSDQGSRHILFTGDLALWAARHGTLAHRRVDERPNDDRGRFSGRHF